MVYSFRPRVDGSPSGDPFASFELRTLSTGSSLYLVYSLLRLSFKFADKRHPKAPRALGALRLSGILLGCRTSVLMLFSSWTSLATQSLGCAGMFVFLAMVQRQERLDLGRS
jgi:hypothetical protein